LVVNFRAVYSSGLFLVSLGGALGMKLRAWKFLFKRHTIEPRELIQAIWQLPGVEPAAHNSSPAEKNNGSVGQAALTPDKEPSYLNEGHRMSGELCFEGSGRIDGEFEGEITATARLIIGENAAVAAKVKAASIVVAGTFSGEITVSDGIEIRPSARVSAKLTQGQTGQGVGAHRGFRFDTAQAKAGGSSPLHRAQREERVVIELTNSMIVTNESQRDGEVNYCQRDSDRGEGLHYSDGHAADEDRRGEGPTQDLAPCLHRFIDEAKAMSRLDSLKEAKRGTGVTCQCGKSARITVRSRTLCYECFDREIARILDPVNYTDQRMRKRIREIDRRYLGRAQHPGILQSV
jgi:cytoskeletal protein CcmA (bactofilin family)